MSSIQQLTTDVNNLLSESKRRYADIRQGCESALVALRKHQPNSAVASITDTEERNAVILPFIKGVKTNNAKIVTISIPVIHKFIMSQLVPPGDLPELLDGLREASNLAIDIQLRILQCLPSLMQVYGTYITGDSLKKLLSICSSLTSGNKSTVVINTASATLQQLFSNIFDKSTKEGSGEDEKMYSINIDEEKPLRVDGTTFESFNIFQDLCSLIENEKPLMYLSDFGHIKVTSVLEIIENVIAGHKQKFRSRPDLSYLLRIRLIPSLLRILSTTVKKFSLVNCTMRIILVLLSSQLSNMDVESEVILSFLNHILLNNDSENDVEWEKILVLELYKGLFSDFNIIKSIFEKYDNDPKKKNVIQELNTILSTYLLNNKVLVPNHMLKPHQPIQPNQPASSPNESSSFHYLSRSGSNIKTSILDHLDKVDPPHSIPPTYPIYLIYNILLLYSEGIANFVQNLSNNGNPTTLEADVEFTNYFIEASYPNISSLFERFLYYNMDNECFHSLVRSLQRFTHATGLLGMSQLRDGLLMILSRAIIHNEDNVPVTSSDKSGSFQEQGKQLLAFGESLVESFTSLQTGSPTLDSRQSMEGPNSLGNLKSRKFNSRHITCLRALANLGVSLTSTLQGSWKIIWMTFQWSDYYVYGPDEYSGYYNNKAYRNFGEDSLPQLTQQDYSNSEASKRKLIESVNEFPIESFEELLDSLVQLDDIQDYTKKVADKDESKEEEEEELVQCPYNKTFYLTSILKICQVNSNKFLVSVDSHWTKCCQYFISLSTNRNLPYKLRIHIADTFNSLIKHLTAQGFGSELPEINSMTAQKSLSGLLDFLNGIFDLGVPKELLVLNCETEIHHLSLTTLHELIDKFDTYYQNSWSSVFEILNTPFRTTTWYNEDKNLKEKVRLLMDSSFHTLKLILDEFMSTLPFSHLKLLIDTLRNFCSQDFDLNTSFSSVSYFWLISDSLKVRISESKSSPNFDLEGKISTIGDEKKLVEFIENTTDQSAESSPHFFYMTLDIYLLSTLVKLSLDQRDQVRDGSIQTFFQIIDVHGALLSSYKSWDLVYKIVFPNLFDANIDLKDPQYRRKEWLESFSLIFSGLVSIFNKFMMDFDNKDTYNKWEILIGYFKGMLEFKWLDLTLKIFRSFRDLLLPFKEVHSSENTTPTPASIKKLIFEFWVQIPVEYDFINLDYQNAATALMECFPSLYHIIKDTMTNEDAKTVIALINKCARYPILPSNQSDDVRPTKLQSATLYNLEIIDIKDKGIESQVIQQLSSMIVYPFGIRNRISQKLEGNKGIIPNHKIPTFIAISHLSTKLLERKFSQIDDYDVLLQEKTINKTLKSLLEVVNNKSRGIVKEDQILWVEANGILKSIVQKVIDSENQDDQELWGLIMSVVQICIVDDEDNVNVNENPDEALTGVSNSSALAEDEKFKMRQYHELISLVMPKLLQSNNQNLIDDFVETLYNNSFLYSFDELELRILKEENNIVGESLIEKITSYDFEALFGTTQPFGKFKNRKTRFQCLDELIKYSHTPKNEHLNTVSQKYLICRVSFCLRRFISEQKLLYKCPISKIQQQEIVKVVEGLNSINVAPENRAMALKVQRLVNKLGRFSCRIAHLDELVEISHQQFLSNAVKLA